MISLLFGLPLSLLPEYYRQRGFSKTSINFERGTIFSGILEMAASAYLFVQGYIIFLQHGSGADLPANLSVGEAIRELVQKTGESPRINPFYGAGMFSLINYLFHWLPLLLAYFALEGFIRFAAALVAGEHVGTLPLYLVGLLHQGLLSIGNELKYGRRLVDEIEWGDGVDFDLRIASCRPKPNWNHIMTVQYGDRFYEVVKQRGQEPPRRFVYLLKEKPGAKVIRGLHNYSPLESVGWRERRRLQASGASAAKTAPAK